jgi:hypothetical protein
MRSIERAAAGGSTESRRAAWTGARHGALPNDLAAIRTRPARVPAVRRTDREYPGPAGREDDRPRQRCSAARRAAIAVVRVA